MPRRAGSDRWSLDGLMRIPRLCVTPTQAREDAARVRALLGQRNIKYGRWTYTCELVPALLSLEERATIGAAAEAIIQAAELVTEYVVQDPAWQRRLGFADEFWSLVKCASGYGMNIPCARFDGVVTPDGFRFIELNTDGCSGMSNVDGMHAAYMEVCGRESTYGLQSAWYDEIVPRVLDTLLRCYERFRATFADSGLPEEPVVGILDLPDEPTHWEFSAIRDALIARGIAAYVVTPASAAFDGRRLTFDNHAVHLIYRRLLGSDYANHLSELKAVSGAFVARRVCMVGALRSQIAFTKQLFAFLHQPELQELLPPDLKEVVCRYVPWTAHLQAGRAQYRGEMIDVIPFVRAHREQFVLKPCVSKLGFGIVQGRFVDQETWHSAIEEAVRKDYVVQEFVELPTAEFPTPDDPETLTIRYVHLGPYVFGGSFCGFMGRTCASPLLSLRSGERLLPVLYQ
ncbi:MAG: hypothetical protein N2595_05200 [bacterium]|nr:hypothetical protein [bacterium]